MNSAEKIIDLASLIDDSKYKDIVEKIKSEAGKIINEG